MLTSESISTTMRSICGSLQIPIIIILLCILAVTLFIVGTVIVELIAERSYLRIWMPQMVDDLKNAEIPQTECIRKSGLLKRQKIALLELTDHKNLTDNMREALAVRLLDEMKARYDLIIKCSDLIVKLGPVCGLLGTLIPLGPGILALGQGDTYTLSQSLLTAFDTTIMGLICAAICTIVSTVRKKWYANDISIMETLMECVLEVEKADA